jgi:glycerol-3-phosphate dehydrogenase
MNREAHIEKLKNDTFDILVIGGGATGVGVALDAATRGLKVALVERDDYAAGTSSRSTKLLHGGVRYLEQAVKRLDKTQFNLVRDALKERALLIKLAPHLAKPLPILTPLYTWFEVPYLMTGLKLYDLLAGRANLGSSRFMSAGAAAQRFPMLRKEGLRGAVLYFDGQFDDARMNVAIALTAAEHGAALANHVEVTALLKHDGRLTGARVRDRLTDDTWEVAARVVVNATGPFADSIRRMDDPNAPAMLTASSGVHIVLNKSFSPPQTGLLIPQTEDGRVLFILPWMGYTLVGTTDSPAPIEAHPRATEDEITYLLRHVAKYFDLPVTRDDVLASWSGLRPLVSNPKAADTARLSRDHVLNTSASGLLTITGGKWTTYRKMALDTVTQAVAQGNLPAGPSQTEMVPLYGGKNYSPEGAARLQEEHRVAADIAQYLSHAYGDQAQHVITHGSQDRLLPRHPHTEAEVIYAAKHESARSTIDVLARRMRLAFLDQKAALEVVPKVADLLADTLGWNDTKRQQDKEAARNYLSTNKTVRVTAS